jgi:hypothetical protein
MSKEEQSSSKTSSEAVPAQHEQDPNRKAPSKAQSMDAAESAPSSPAPEPPRVPEQKQLDTVLHMPSPGEDDTHKPPHLKTPPYVHHFDTYGLVKDLAKSGFSEEQAITIMKALRGILTDNMGLARASLVSKSDVENETYMFRAACSEVRTEVSNNRKNETMKMRSERNQLQHEVDILSQRLTQESLSLKDELKGLFDDRKMGVRQEQRAMESKIQELNYKITVALNSDARSEVEGLRWVLTRRAAIAVGISAFMLFALLRYSSYVAHAKAEAEKKSNGNGSSGGDGSNPTPRNSNSSDKEAALTGEILASEGGVSIG